MTDLAQELEALVMVYGHAIPPLPRAPRVASYTCRMDANLFDFAQRMASDRRLEYQGDVGALIRHAVALYLMALGRVLDEPTSPIAFEMEMLRRHKADEDFTEWAEHVQSTLKEASAAARLAGGKSRVVAMLTGLVKTISRHQDMDTRLRMQSYLAGQSEFTKLVAKTDEEELKTWLELIH